MKGISAIIAVVLILMITVALAAMAYVWFTGVFGEITEGAGEAATQAGEMIGTSFSIASATHTASDSYAIIYIANTGTVNMKLNEVNIFVSDKLTGKAADTFSGTLSPGAIATLKINNNTINTTADYNSTWCNNIAKVSYGSLEQVATITC